MICLKKNNNLEKKIIQPAYALLWPYTSRPNLTAFPATVIFPFSFPANISVYLTFTLCIAYLLTHLNELGIVNRTARLHKDQQSISPCLVLPFLKHDVPPVTDFSETQILFSISTHISNVICSIVPISGSDWMW